MKNLIKEYDLMLAGTQYENKFDNSECSRAGSKLELIIEENNPIDPLAVAVKFQGLDIGYVPRSENLEVAYYLSFPDKFTVDCRLKKRKNDEYSYEMIVVNIYIYAIAEDYQIFSYDIFDEWFPNYDKIVKENSDRIRISEQEKRNLSDNLINNNTAQSFPNLSPEEIKLRKEISRKENIKGCKKAIIILFVIFIAFIVFSVIMALVFG